MAGSHLMGSYTLTSQVLLSRVLELLGPYVVGTWGVRDIYYIPLVKNPKPKKGATLETVGQSQVTTSLSVMGTKPQTPTPARKGFWSRFCKGVPWHLEEKPKAL